MTRPVPVLPAPVLPAPILVVLLALAAAPAAAQTIPPVWQNWIASLPGQGYTVTQGTAAEVAPSTGTAAGPSANPRYAYLEPYVPIGAAYVDPYYAAPLTVTTPAGVQANPYYRLASTEAVVTIVALPPLAAYFSLQTNMYTRLASLYPKVQLYSPDPSRAEIFGSVNNGNNNATIAGQAGLGFGQGAVAFITTANAALAASLVQSFTAAGGEAAQILLDPIGPNIDIGLTASSDDLLSLFRYSAAQSASLATAWGAAAASNILVYRIGQPAGGAVSPYGSIAYYNKLFNANEASHTATLAQLASILQNWLAAQQGSATTAPTVSSEKVTAQGTPATGAVGAYCIQTGDNCGGDDQDSDAYKTANIGPLPAGDLFFVAGVDHTVTNNATYVGLNIQGNTVPGYVAVAGQVNAAAAGFAAGTLTGSAAAVLQDLGLSGQASPRLTADLPNLYVQIFARPCTHAQTYCTQPYTTVLTPGVLPYADTVKVSERAYLLPGQLNGANPTKLLNPKVIH